MTSDKYANFYKALDPWLIAVANGEKMPAWAWGGYDVNPMEADEVYDLEGAAEADHGRWGYVDVRDEEE